MFASHHWPRWGAEDVDGFLRKQRDMYRYIHDQTMRWANHGETPTEIAERVSLPSEFSGEAHTTGYYGHLAHNVKAVYQRYLSWYDGNPANLWRLPPTELAARYVALAGGAGPALAAARDAYENGDYRWVAELAGHLVFNDPSHREARELQADAFEQLGYQSESATFRNAYLSGAQELRHGHPPRRAAVRRGYLDAMTVDQLIDSIAVRLRAEEVADRSGSVNLELSDRDGAWRVELSNRTLSSSTAPSTPPDATVTLAHADLVAIASGEITPAELITEGRVTVVGNADAFGLVFGHLDVFESMFPIVEP